MMSVGGGGFHVFNGASVTHLILPEQSCAKENNDKPSQAKPKF